MEIRKPQDKVKRPEPYIIENARRTVLVLRDNYKSEDTVCIATVFAIHSDMINVYSCWY